MRILKLSSFLSLVMIFGACGTDDDSDTSCIQSDWIGTYIGTQNCDGTSENVTVTITASGSDAIVVKYKTPNIDTEYDPLIPDGCDLDKADSSGGITVTVKASLNCNEITIKEVLSAGGSNATCTITASRN